VKKKIILKMMTTELVFSGGWKGGWMDEFMGGWMDG
jgi:hypothetical protein